jgi:hypothetical protein
MKAFLKRRWILLSYAVVLLPCTMINACFALWNWNGWMCYVGADDGHVGIVHGESANIIFPAPSFHAPELGATPQFFWETRFRVAALPIWCVLSVILGGIVVRELRWRKKRARATAAAE